MAALCSRGYKYKKKRKKESNLEAFLKILSDDSCFSVERRVIFQRRNVKCKDYVSCQFVETKHLRLICIRRTKSRSSSTRKNPRKSDYQVFSTCFRKSNI